MKYGIVIDSSGSMMGWGYTIAKIYEGLREKLLEIGKNLNEIDVWFLPDWSGNYVHLSAAPPSHDIRERIDKCAGDTSGFELGRIVNTFKYDILFVISDGYFSSLPMDTNTEPLVFVTDALHKDTVKEALRWFFLHNTMDHMPLLIIDPLPFGFVRKFFRKLWRKIRRMLS